jgi:hypothetical protein
MPIHFIQICICNSVIECCFTHYTTVFEGKQYSSLQTSFTYKVAYANIWFSVDNSFFQEIGVTLYSVVYFLLLSSRTRRPLSKFTKKVSVHDNHLECLLKSPI